MPDEKLTPEEIQALLGQVGGDKNLSTAQEGLKTSQTEHVENWWKELPETIQLTDGRIISVRWAVRRGYDKFGNRVEYSVPSSLDFTQKDWEEMTDIPIQVRLLDSATPDKLYKANKDDLSYLNLKPEDIYSTSRYGLLVNQLEEGGLGDTLTLLGVSDYLLVQAQYPNKFSAGFMGGLASVLTKIKNNPTKSLEILQTMPDFPKTVKPPEEEWSGQQQMEARPWLNANPKTDFTSEASYEEARQKGLESQYQELKGKQEIGAWNPMAPTGPEQMAQADLVGAYEQSQARVKELQTGAPERGEWGANQVALQAETDKALREQKAAAALAEEAAKKRRKESEWSRLVGTAKNPEKRVGI